MENIMQILGDISKRKNVKILFACETGSRAWGFPSPDSDYDVRLIYMHERDWYLSLGQRKDTIEHMDGDMDITGWDLKKCLQMLKKSNAPLIERFRSPIIYSEEPGFANDFRNLIGEYYSPTAVFFHHYALAAKFWADLKDRKEVKLKSFFYLVRSLLSCNWIILEKSVLPMNIFELMDKIDRDIRERVEKLIVLKSGVGEKYLHQRDEVLYMWVEEIWEKIESSKGNLGVSKAGFASLSDFFLKMVNGNVDN